MAEQLFKFNLLAGQITRRERGRWAASTVSLPREPQLLLCTTPHDVDAHLVPANAS